MSNGTPLSSPGPELPPPRTVFGHPPGLFTLFFAEMWERFSFYGMKALLVLYMMKGFLEYKDPEAYAVLGAYTALVYMAPFFGGILADRLLGARRAVVLGGALMAIGECLLMFPQKYSFFGGLAFLIAGNGFFKPNISTIVGSLYPPGSIKRDGGFTVFYMGINLGAAMSPLLCGYIGEKFGWEYGFGIATAGMLVGLAVFVTPRAITQITIMAGSVAAAAALATYHLDNPYALAVNLFVGAALVVAAVVAWGALNRGGVPDEAGQPPDRKRLSRRVLGPLTAEALVLLGTIASIPVFTLLVSGFAPLTRGNRPVSLVPESTIKEWRADGMMNKQLGKFAALAEKRDTEALERFEENLSNLYSAKNEQEGAEETNDLRKDHYQALKELIGRAEGGDWNAARSGVGDLAEKYPPRPIQDIAAVVAQEASRPAGIVLGICTVLAFGYIVLEMFRLDRIPRQRMYVVMVLTFFSLIFWAFFEQAGSSLNIFTDRNVNRVFSDRTITKAEIGRTLQIEPTQAQLGYHNGKKLFTADQLDKLREDHKEKTKKTPGDGKPLVIDWTVAPDNDGMAIARDAGEVPTSALQAVNPIYILLFGLVFSALWTVLGRLGWEPSTPTKFALGLLQLGMAFGIFWLGTKNADNRGMVAISWLLLGYLVQTTGELCLSPVGLSMVTKLSPARLVATVMGVWFLTTGLSQYLASIIAQFTSVTEGGGEKVIPPPQETLHVYGDVFGQIAIASFISAAICFALVPFLKRWMHPEADAIGAEAAGEVTG